MCMCGFCDTHRRYLLIDIIIGFCGCSKVDRYALWLHTGHIDNFWIEWNSCGPTIIPIRSMPYIYICLLTCIRGIVNAYCVVCVECTICMHISACMRWFRFWTLVLSVVQSDQTRSHSATQSFMVFPDACCAQTHTHTRSRCDLGAHGRDSSGSGRHVHANMYIHLCYECVCMYPIISP